MNSNLIDPLQGFKKFGQCFLSILLLFSPFHSHTCYILISGEETIIGKKERWDWEQRVHILTDCSSPSLSANIVEPSDPFFRPAPYTRKGPGSVHKAGKKRNLTYTETYLDKEKKEDVACFLPREETKPIENEMFQWQRSETRTTRWAVPPTIFLSLLLFSSFFFLFKLKSKTVLDEAIIRLLKKNVCVTSKLIANDRRDW